MKGEMEKKVQLEQTVKIKEKEVDSLNAQVRDLKLKMNQLQTRQKESDENNSHLESMISKLETRKSELKFEGNFGLILLIKLSTILMEHIYSK